MDSSGRVRRPYHLLAFDFMVAVAMWLRGPEHSVSTHTAIEGLLDQKARQEISVALAHWRVMKRRDDEHWNIAFSALGEALSHASYLDVRLYMYMLSDEAALLFRFYESEMYD